MRPLRLFAVAAVFLLILPALSCGNSNPLLITGALPPTATVGLAYSGSLTASAGTGSYTWVVKGLPAGLAATGTSSATLTVSGMPTTPGTFEVTASVADSNSRVDSYTSGIAVSTSPVLTINGSLPFTGTVGTPYSGSVNATGGTPPYSWVIDKLPPGVTPSGENTPVLSVAGTPTTDGGYNVSITLSDSIGSTANASLTIAIDNASSAHSNANPAAACASPIAPRGSEAGFTQPYAFLLKGVTASGNPVAWAGSFTPNGSGRISQADADSISASDGPHSYRVDLNASSYSLGADGRGCLELFFSGDNTSSASPSNHQPNPILANASSAARFTLAPPSSSALDAILLAFTINLASKTGVITESSATNAESAVTGQMRQQTANDFYLNNLSSRFALGLDGWLLAGIENVERVALAGSFSNAAGAISAGAADLNIGGIPSGELRGGVGVLAAPVSATGRGTGTYAIETASGPLAFDFAYYRIDASNFYLISTDAPLPGNLILSGQAAAAAEISTPLNGRYLAALTGLDPDAAQAHLGTNFVYWGFLQASNSSDSTTQNFFVSEAGKIETATSLNIAATLDPSAGRATFSNFGAIAPVAYLTATSAENSIAAFLVGTDSATSSGILIRQR